MHLLVDVGNTRAKWALSNGLELRDHAHATHTELATTLRTYLAAHGTSVTGAVVANVAGTSIARLLGNVIVECTQREPRFLQSPRELCGVRNAYLAPERLGIDRLVAMIGARQLYSGSLCVVCIGTALTVDAIDRAGQHQGGLIVPGPQLMVSSLIVNTSEIGPRAAQGERAHGLLAIDTRGAIEQGAEQALAALIDRVSSMLQTQLGEPLTVILTGGAADAIAGLVSATATVVPDLTLRGLAVIANEPSAG